MSADTTVDTTNVLTLTENAAEKVRGFLADADEASEVALRVAVQAGGCAGFRYALFFDDRALDNDLVEEQHGITYPSIEDTDGRAVLALSQYVPASAVPVTLVLDRQGRVAARVLGAVREATLTALLDSTLAEAP